jgi:hypothetical protein
MVSQGMPILAYFKNKTSRTVLLTILFLFYSRVVFSAGYAGIITAISSAQSEVKVKTQVSSRPQEFTLLVTTPGDAKLFKRLKIGDYISFQAQSTSKKNYYNLTSVDYVGLSDVLGLWYSSDGLCYNFTFFSQLVVFPQNQVGACDSDKTSQFPGYPKSFKYFITPNESSWDILVGDSDLYFSAEFYFKATNEIFARIFNTDTGKIETELMFWR